MIFAGIAVIYTLFLMFAAGMKFLLLSAILYGPGTMLYIWPNESRTSNSLPRWNGHLCRRAHRRCGRHPRAGHRLYHHLGNIKFIMAEANPKSSAPSAFTRRSANCARSWSARRDVRINA